MNKPLGFVWLGLGVALIGVAARSSAAQVAGLIIATVASMALTRSWAVFSRRWHMFRRAAGGRR